MLSTCIVGCCLTGSNVLCAVFSIIVNKFVTFSIMEKEEQGLWSQTQVGTPVPPTWKILLENGLEGNLK